MLERVKIVGEPVFSRLYLPASAAYPIGQILFDTNLPGVQLQVSVRVKASQHRGDSLVTTSVELPGLCQGSAIVVQNRTRGKLNTHDATEEAFKAAGKMPSIIELKANELWVREKRGKGNAI